MAVASARTQTITYTGDVTGSESVSAASNVASPGSITIHTLVLGANTITVPVGATCTAATIVPPSANVQTLTLKGVTGDTGIPLHLTDPTTLALAASATTFCLTAGGVITALRIYWS